MWPPEIGDRIRQRNVRFIQKRAVNVCEKVVRPDQRKAVRHRQSFGKTQADQQRGNQSRPLRHRDRIQIAECHARFAERRLRHRIERNKMFPRSQVRDHAAVDGVFRNLGGNATRNDLVTVANHRNGGLVAARFDPKNQTHDLPLIT